MKLSIGPTLTHLMHEQRRTLREVSEATGVSKSTLSEWSTNRRPKDPVQVCKVADFLGVSMHFLLFGEEDRKEPLTRIMREEFFSGVFEITIKRVKVNSN